MKEKDNQEISYAEWFKNIWLETGGLIPPATAAKILKVPRSRINKIWQDKKLKKYISSPNDKKPMLSVSDVLTLAANTYKDETTPVIEYNDNETGYTIKIIKHGLPKERFMESKEEMNNIYKTIKRIYDIIQFFVYTDISITDKPQKNTFNPKIYRPTEDVYYEVKAELERQNKEATSHS